MKRLILIPFLLCALSASAQSFTRTAAFRGAAVRKVSSGPQNFVLIDSQTNDLSGQLLGYAVEYSRASSSFVPSQSGDLRKVTLKLDKADTADSHIVYRVRADDGAGLPGTVVGTATNTVLLSSLVNVPGAEVDFYLNAGATLTAGQTNHHSLELTNYSSTYYGHVRFKWTANQTTCRSSDGTTWQNYSGAGASNQWCFKTYYLQ